MFRNVLVCSDLSSASDALINCINDMRELGVTGVILAHVVHSVPPISTEAKLTQEAFPVLERQKQVLQGRGFAVEVVIAAGVPAHVLAGIADEHDVSLIAVGSHGRGRVAATLGSVSTALLHQVRRPVLLVRNALWDEHKEENICRRMLSRILFPTDFSEAAERALEHLVALGSETSCAIRLLHVIAEKSHDAAESERQEEAGRYLLEAKKRRLETQSRTEVSVELVRGDPVEEILHRVETGEYSMIVMGSHGKGAVREVLFGTVAGEVAHRAAVPILFVPAPET